jgi:branched-subunit amino acid ABC-type transport system permease component
VFQSLRVALPVGSNLAGFGGVFRMKLLSMSPKLGVVIIIIIIIIIFLARDDEQSPRCK